MKEMFNNLKFVWKYTKGSRFQLIMLFILNILFVITSIIIPIYDAKVIVALTDNELTRLLFIAFVLFVLSLFDSLFGYLWRKYIQIVYRETLIKLQTDLGKSILTLENKTIDANSSGVFIQRLTSDTSKLADVFSALNEYLGEIVTNIGVFVAVLTINIHSFIYLLTFTIILYLVNKKRVHIRNIKDKDLRKEKERLTSFIGELVRGVRDVKMLNSEKSFSNEMINRSKEVNNKAYDMQKTDRAYTLLDNFIGHTRNFGLLALFAYLINKDLLTATSALIVYNYSSRVNWVTNTISYFMEYMRDFNLSTNRIKDIIDDKTFKKEHFGNIHLDNVEGNFEFKNVTFKYEKNRKILDKINFKVNANETVAFVGKTGSGKSTIFSLLCKMYEPTSGKITIDGVDIKKLDKDSIRGNITIISQNPYIFNVSIKDNLKLVKEDVTDEEIENACKLACLDS